VIEEFPYAIVYFQGSMDLSLPEREDWDASGEKNDLVKCFLILNVILFIFWVHRRVSNGCIVSSCK
jgi:hypothetical protein